MNVTNSILLTNSRPGFATKQDALIDGIPDEMIVFATDEALFFSEDDTIRCDGCEDHYFSRSELDDAFLCEECAEAAREEDQHMQDLNADWSASRGCDMGQRGH